MNRSLSMFRESLSMSYSNIKGNKMRSFLTMLGIVIGVMAIIALITIVQSATGQITEEFSAMGTGRLTVSAQGTPLKRGLTTADLEDIASLNNVAGIAPSISSSATVKSEYGWEEDVTLDGQNEVYFAHNSDLVGRGRAINYLDVESKSNVVLIDETLQQKLFYAKDPLGEKLYINGMEFTVIGVLSDAGSSDVMSQAMGGSSDSGQVIIPYTSAMRLTGQNNITSLTVYVEDTNFTDQVVAELEQTLKAAFNYKDNSYSVINMESLLSTMNTLLSMMTMLLVGIASIALLVGGIGIMNMMLVSVTERTTEIGLRKALGAEPGQIQLQFLIESIILAISGGIIGVILGLVVSWAVALLMGTAFTIIPYAIALGVGFSAAIGIIFGWAPARKASNLNPIDALRSV